MRRPQNGGYLRSGNDTVSRGCDHCDWYAVGDSYPELVEGYQDHLRTEHPRAWVRG